MPLGPPVIDPIVGQPTNVIYLLTVSVGATKQMTSLKVHRPLFGSGAALGAVSERETDEDETRRQAEADARRLEEEAARKEAAEEEEARRLAEEAERLRRADEAARRAHRRRTLAAALGLGAAADRRRRRRVLVRLRHSRLRSRPLPSRQSAERPPATETALSCTGLDAAGCYEVGERALQQRQLEPARQLLQQASSLGSLEANIALARMYDPETWAAETSPVSQPNWETAVFWYEKAARQCNLVAQTNAGRLLCTNGKGHFERRQGRAYLEQAANAGNDEARQLLSTCP